MELVEETFENDHKKIPKTDWSVNKYGNKNRAFFKHYKASDCFEHSMTFKLSSPAELREL